VLERKDELVQTILKALEAFVAGVPGGSFLVQPQNPSLVLCTHYPSTGAGASALAGDQAPVPGH
jgi:hypothetical protein